MVQLSVLDSVPVGEGQSTRQALHASLALARLADHMGFSRMWFTEVHNQSCAASTNPAVLIPMIANATSHIGVGSGGIILPNHSPLSIAEQFALLEAAYPGRIDLGIGRAPNADLATGQILRRPTEQEVDRDFPRWVRHIQHLLGDGLAVDADGMIPDDDAPAVPLQSDPIVTGTIPVVSTPNLRFAHPVSHTIQATPQPSGRPQMWLLGSSPFSAELAASLGLPYVFAHHFSGQHTGEVLGRFRDSWRHDERARCFIAVNVVIGDDDEDARRLARPFALTMTGPQQGRPMPDVDHAAPLDDATFDHITRNWLIGTAYSVAESIFELADTFGIDEVMIHPVAGRYSDEPIDRYPQRENALSTLASLLGTTD